VKKESSPSNDAILTPTARRIPVSASAPIASSSRIMLDGGEKRKRPRRSAAASVRSYAVPDSDDEAIAEQKVDKTVRLLARKRKVESNLQRWIKHLSILLKEEQKKVGIPFGTCT